MEVEEIEVSKIKFNDAQPRKSVVGIKKLAASIEQCGLLQPITVSKSSVGDFVVVFGERRLRAFRLLKREKIPAIVVNASDDIAMLAENCARSDLCVIEKIVAIDKIFSREFKDYRKIFYKIVNEKHDEDTKRMKEKCSAIGLSPSTIYNALCVLHLSDTTREEILSHREFFSDAVVLKLARANIKDKEKEIEIVKSIKEKKLIGGSALTYIAKRGCNIDGMSHFYMLFGSHKRNIITRLQEIVDDGRMSSVNKEKLLADVKEIRMWCDAAIQALKRQKS